MDNYFTNMGELKNILKLQAIAWLKKQQQRLPEILKDFIMSEYYDQYEPKIYERKYRILNAIMVSEIDNIGDEYFISIYLDPVKVSYDPAFWYDVNHSNYAQRITGDTTEQVFDNIASGIHGSPTIQTEGRFWDTFLDSLKNDGILNIFDDFKDYLTKTGLVKIRVK